MDYTTWIENLLLEYEPVYLCEGIMDTEDGKEWCEKNCHHSEPQRQCLRKAYEIGDKRYRELLSELADKGGEQDEDQ